MFIKPLSLHDHPKKVKISMTDVLLLLVSSFFFFQLLITLIMFSNLNLSVLLSRQRLLLYFAMCSLPLEVSIVHPLKNLFNSLNRLS